jgi:hypothetical protein
MTQLIPLSPVSSQSFSVVLGDQICQIKVRQKNVPAFMMTMGIYVDLYVNNALIIGGVIAENLNRIVRDLYLGFQGDLVFYDTTGQGRDPYYTGLGSDFVLLWIEPEELPPGVG